MTPLRGIGCASPRDDTRSTTESTAVKDPRLENVSDASIRVVRAIKAFPATRSSPRETEKSARD